MSALFIITKGNVTSDCVVHYYKLEREFISLSALFIITKGNVNSSDYMGC